MMLRGRGYSFNMPFDAEAIRFEAMTKHLNNLTPTILKAMGVFLTGEAVRDFRDKSEGKTAGGVKWDKIGLSGARSRYAARGEYASQTKQLEKIRSDEDPLREELRRKLPKGASKKKNRQKIAHDFMETKSGEKLKRLQDRRKGVLEKRKSAIDNEMKRAKTGIDTGRLIASLVFGVPEYAEIRVPTPRDTKGMKPADLSIVGGKAIRIGSNLDYSGYFDERRPIIDPARFMTPERMERLDKVIRKTIDLENKIQGFTRL